MLDASQLRELLKLPEADYLDYKRSEYDLSEPVAGNSKGYLNLIKDVLCMSNTPRDDNAYIITGVINDLGVPNEITGIQSHLDDSMVQQLIESWIEPYPTFLYYEIEIEDKYVGVYEIRLTPQTGPFYLKNDLKRTRRKMISDGSFLLQNRLYFRKGTRNYAAETSDEKRIISWFNSYIREERWQLWDQFLQACDSFEDRRHYILIASPLDHVPQTILEPFSRIAWSAVIDFDPESDASGLLRAFRDGSYDRNIIRIVKGEGRAFNLRHDTYWFFARGLTGRHDTLLDGEDWREWTRKYRRELDEQFNHIANTLMPNPITFVVVWKHGFLLEQLQRTIESTTDFDTSCKLVFVSESNNLIKGVIHPDLAPEYFDIPIEKLSSGLSNRFPDLDSNGSEFAFPSDTGARVQISVERRTWLQSQMDVLHRSLPAGEDEGGADDRYSTEYYRGAMISWDDLEFDRDVTRDVTRKISRRVEQELRKRAPDKISIVHKPGAGGTTIARRIAWDLHGDFPCVSIRSGDADGVVERIEYIIRETNLTVLALADSAFVGQREIDNIYNLLRARKSPCVLLCVSRRHHLTGERIKNFPLGIRLSNFELSRFYERFSGLVPEKRSALLAVRDSARPQEQTVFQFGLAAYGKKYIGLSDYVSHRLSGLTTVQRKILVLLSMAFNYGQKGISAQAFQYLLGISPREVLLENVFESQQSVLDILMYEDMAWRPIHQIVAEEILNQSIGTPNGDRPELQQHISTWAREFIEFSAEGWLTTSNSAMELLRRMFIFRDTEDVLGRELTEIQNSTNSRNPRIERFAKIFSDIGSPEGGLEVMRCLTEKFPDEAHFWAHLGRYLSEIMRNYEQSLRAVDQAIQLQPNDHVLWHVKGMSYRSYAMSLMEQRKGISDVVEIAQKSSECFHESRSLNPQHDHAYISEVQLLTRLLNYAARDTDGSVVKYVSQSSVPYLREAIDNAESLLALVRSNRNHFEQSTSYEQDCRAAINSLYGNYSDALEIWENMLSRPGVNRTSVRRSIVYTLTARGRSNWGKMSLRNRDRCITLLQENLDEQPSNSRDLRLWLQAVRYSSHLRSVESLIEKVSYWKANTDALDATYYLYVLYTLQAIDGLTLELDLATRFMRECNDRSRNRRNRHDSFEWLGDGDGIGRLVHHSDLGNWNDEIRFWANTSRLVRVEGVVSKWRGPESGEIMLRCGLACFFAPGRRDNPISKDSINRQVDFFLGFSYSGIRAWDVKYAD